MSKQSDFSPNWASMPGDSITDILHERSIQLHDFAQMMESNENEIIDLLHGFITINPRIAEKLEKVLGGSSAFWLQREQFYRSSIERLRHVEEDKWIKELPVKDMVRFHWIAKSENIVSACLEYFKVPDVWTWRKKYSDINTYASFRKSPTFKSMPALVASWVRQAEIQAEKIECNDWNPIRFQDALPKMKSLSRVKDASSFFPKLQSLCADCGVALVVAPTPQGCAASGAAKFMSNKKAFIVQSFRYGTDDHFWFTFFHEAGHLLLHGSKEVFIDENDFSEMIDQIELEANQFSVSTLIPEDVQHKLATMKVTERAVRDAANAAGVSLGIIVGQLQHMGKIPFNHYAGYKRKYNWATIEH